MRDPTKRFADRVADYVKYRPGYPPAVVELLARECGLYPGATVADIGCGTGQLSRLFLDGGYRVLGVEPNREMREAGQRLLRGYPGFTVVGGRAEDTELPDAGVDLIVVAQAFHWFDAPRARTEFARILHADGWVALIWNERRPERTPLLGEYEQFLRSHGTDYLSVARKPADLDSVRRWMGSNRFRAARFENHQILDFEGLRGRVLSCSYIPPRGHPGHDAMLASLRRLFQRHQRQGRIRLDYETDVYYGRL